MPDMREEILGDSDMELQDRERGKLQILLQLEMHTEDGRGEEEMIREIEPTRRGILKEYLEIEEAALRVESKNMSKLEPKEGRERQWDYRRKRCGLLRDMIQALESEPVRKAMSDWQRMIMEEDEKGKRHRMTL